MSDDPTVDGLSPSEEQYPGSAQPQSHPDLAPLDRGGGTPPEPWVLVDEESYGPPASGGDPTPTLRLGSPSRTPRLVKGSPKPRATPTSAQRLLLLDTWRRSALPAGDFAALVGVSKHTLYAWRKRFDEAGPASLVDQPKGPKEGSRLPEVTRRTILMLKEDNPDWGCQRISDVLARASGLGASAGAVSRVLHEAGYELQETRTEPHKDHPRFFERAAANQLWQTDLGR